VDSLTRKSNDGFYFSEEVGFEPDVKKNDKKNKGDKKDGKGENKKPKQKN
jgi:hypothetical protein